VKPRGRKPSHCKHCGKLPDWRGLQEHHLEPGNGKRKYSESEWWCAPCHFGKDGHRTEGIERENLPDRPLQLAGYHGTSGKQFTKEMQAGVIKKVKE